MSARLRIPRLARQFVIDGYGGAERGRLLEAARVPHLTCPRQALVRVAAASINPLDTRMASGYGREVLATLRSTVREVCSHDEFNEEFPLVLGRDFVGEVLDVGADCKDLSVGDRVFGATFPSRCGTHQDIISVDNDSVIRLPDSVKDTIAASAVPYAGITAWNALIGAGGYQIESSWKSKSQRILILGASGAVGSMALQLALVGGTEVVAVGGNRSRERLQALGVPIVLSYEDPDYNESLISLAGFDIILDAGGLGRAAANLVGLLRTGGRLVTVDSPLLNYTDSQGMFGGLLASGMDFLSDNYRALAGGSTLRWAFFSPNTKALEFLGGMLADGSLTPFVDKVFPLTEAQEAYKYFQERKCSGKVVLTM